MRMLKNMKKIKIVAFTVSLVLALAGCNNIFSDSDSDTNSNKNGLANITVESLTGDIIAADPGARATSTIVSTQLTKLNIAKVVITADGTKKDNTALEDEYKSVGTWTSDADASEDSGNAIVKMQADRTISIPEGTYTFAITLYDAEGNATATGSIANKTISTGYNALSFLVNKTDSGKGALSITANFKAADRVSSVKAGLEKIDFVSSVATATSSDKTVEGFESELLTIGTSKADTNNKYAVYAKSQVPSGQYVLKIDLYGKVSDADGAEEIVLNTYTDIIHVEPGLTTIGTRDLTLVNTLYKVSFNTNGGSWDNGYEPVTIRNANTSLMLPTSASISKEGCTFMGWYENAQLTGDAVAKISGGTAADKTFYAKWEKNTLSYQVTIHASEKSQFTVTGTLTNDYVKVSAPADFESYKWFIDNKYYEEYNNTATIMISANYLKGGSHDFTVHVKTKPLTVGDVEVSDELSAQVIVVLEKLPEFPITYKNAVFENCDFGTDNTFTGKHEKDYPTIFYFGGKTVLDYPTMQFYDFDGWYDKADASGDRIAVISGEAYIGEVTLYAKWTPKNPLKVTLPANTKHSLSSMNLMSSSSVLNVYGDFGGTDKWYTYQFFQTGDKQAVLRSDVSRETSNTKSYYSFYPNTENANAVFNLDYTGQVQSENGSSAHVLAKDFMCGKVNNASDYKDLNTSLAYAQLGELLNFKVSGVPADKQFKEMVLYVPDVYIPTKGTVDISAATPAFNCTETKPCGEYNHYKMTLSNITAADGNLDLYTMLPPFDASGKTVILTLIDSDNNYYNAYFDGANFTAGSVNVLSASSVTALPHFVTIGGIQIATHNLGAYSPEDYGNLYAYGDDVSDALSEFGGSKPSITTYQTLAGLTGEAVTVHGVHGIKFTSGEATLFVAANGYCSADGSGIVRNTEVNLWTNSPASGDFVYTLYGSSEDLGVLAYSDKNTYKYGIRAVK